MNKKFAVLFPLFLVCFEICIYLSKDAYAPALSHIAADLHTSANAAQLTITFWLLGGFFSQLVIGPISDHMGDDLCCYGVASSILCQHLHAA